MRFIYKNSIDYSKIDIIKGKYKRLMNCNYISNNINICNKIDGSNINAKLDVVVNFNYNYEISLTKIIYDELELEELEAIIAHEFGHAIINQNEIMKFAYFKSEKIKFLYVYFFKNFKHSEEIELQADEEALKITKNPGALINALIKTDGLIKMHKKNFIDKYLSRIRQPIHPSLEKRINHIRYFRNHILLRHPNRS